MYPDLLGIFGVQLYGLVFERVIWGLLSAFMLWGVFSSIGIIRRGSTAEGLIQGGIVGVVLFWACEKFIDSFSDGYRLFFTQPIVLHSYAFCILVGIGFGIYTAMKQARYRNFDPYDMAKLCLMLVIFGFLGARAAHVIVEAPLYWNSCFNPAEAGLSEPDCLRVLNFAEGGLTFYGGVIAGMLVLAWFFIRRYRRGQEVATLSVMDILASALAVTHGFGRIGCLAAGCCWGAVATNGFGLRYGPGAFAYDELINNPLYHDMMLEDGLTPALHATQIYESAGEFVLYAILWAMLLHHAKPGKMAGFWLIGYGIMRFILEIMRDDAERGYFFEKAVDPVNRFFAVDSGHSTILTTSQGIALVMTAVGIVVLIFAHYRGKKEDAGRENATECDVVDAAKPDGKGASNDANPGVPDGKGASDDAKPGVPDGKGASDDAKPGVPDGKGASDDAKPEAPKE